MRSSRWSLVVAVVLGSVFVSSTLAQQPSGPATHENLVTPDGAPKPATTPEAKAANAVAVRPAGTLLRPTGGVQHPDLDKAWATYDAAVAKAEEGIKAIIAKQFDAATARGDLDAAERWQAINETFEKAGTLPAESAVKPTVAAAVSELSKAGNDLTKAYEAVVKALTKEQKIAEAQAVRDEYRIIDAARQAAFAHNPAGQKPKRHDDRGPRVPGKRQAAEGPVADKVGALIGTTWKYDHNGDVFTLREGGRVVRDGNDAAIATWQVVDSQVLVRQLQGEWVDTMTLSPDGMVLAGRNDRGKAVRATRVPIAE